MEKRIKDFLPQVKDFYLINDKGEIFSDNLKGGKMKEKDNHGYKRIVLSQENGSQKAFQVHRLVLMAFGPVEGFEDMQVNHIDGDKSNNRLENLEWCTASENQLHAIRTGLKNFSCQYGESNSQSSLTLKEVKEMFTFREQGWTQQKIADKFGCSRRHVGNILQGKRWSQALSSTTIPQDSEENQ